MKQCQYYFQLTNFPDEAPDLFEIRANYQYQKVLDQTSVAAFPEGEMPMETLRLERINRSLTQDDMAKAMGVKKAAVSRLENAAMDGREPAFSTLQRYAGVLGYRLVIACVPKPGCEDS